MTYWATLYYAGKVVVTMAYPGQTYDECVELGKVMMFDIGIGYIVEAEVMAESMFPDQKAFTFECLTERLAIDEEYIAE